MTPGEYVMLAVSDTGSGINKEDKGSIFEPFFTTKGESGTGLGLATAYGIVKQHGGNIWVYSEPEKGSTFKVYLPVSKEARTEEKETIEKAANLGGTETILLVEDNQQLLNLCLSILKSQGYTVIAAPNGAEALSMMDNYNETVGLLLTDVVMPNMNGKELYSRLSETYPELKVLYMSGYTDNVIARRGVLDEGTQFIQKPFSVHSLSTKVREILDE